MVVERLRTRYDAMGQPQVVVQARLERELFAAVRTLERLFARVQPLVIVEAGRVRKRLLAHLALERLLARVNSHVRGER